MKNARLFIFATFLLVGVHLTNAVPKKMTVEEVKEAVVSLKKVCIDQSGVSAALVESAAIADVYPADRNLMCFNKCILTMMKSMKGNTLRPHVMISQSELMLVDDAAVKVKAVVEKCAEKVPLTGSDACEVAWGFAKCYYETDRSLAFF